MSKSTFDAVFMDALAEQKRIIMHQTWGHLFPEKPDYVGQITLASTMYEGVVVVNEKIDINGSPWWHSALHNWANKQEKTMKYGEVTLFDVAVVIKTTKKEISTIHIKSLKKTILVKGN